VAAEASQEVTVRPATAAEILPFVADAARFDPKTQTGAVQRVARNGSGYVIEQAGVPVMGYTVEVDGGELFITSASGRAAFDLVKLGLGVIEKQAAGFDSVGFKTMRRGLVKKAQKQGYRIVAYIMRKDLK
jgi:hypothetical protein